MHWEGKFGKFGSVTPGQWMHWEGKFGEMSWHFFAFPFRLLGGAVGSDVTPGQLIPQVGNSGPLPI